jgi:hypothetical protein
MRDVTEHADYRDALAAIRQHIPAAQAALIDGEESKAND